MFLCRFATCCQSSWPTFPWSLNPDPQRRMFASKLHEDLLRQAAETKRICQTRITHRRIPGGVCLCSHACLISNKETCAFIQTPCGRAWQDVGGLTEQRVNWCCSCGCTRKPQLTWNAELKQEMLMNVFERKVW